MNEQSKLEETYREMIRNRIEEQTEKISPPEFLFRVVEKISLMSGGEILQVGSQNGQFVGNIKNPLGKNNILRLVLRSPSGRKYDPNEFEQEDWWERFRIAISFKSEDGSYLHHDSITYKTEEINQDTRREVGEAAELILMDLPQS